MANGELVANCSIVQRCLLSIVHYQFLNKFPKQILVDLLQKS